MYHLKKKKEGTFEIDGSSMSQSLDGATFTMVEHPLQALCQPSAFSELFICSPSALCVCLASFVFRFRTLRSFLKILTNWDFLSIIPPPPHHHNHCASSPIMPAFHVVPSESPKVMGIQYCVSALCTEISSDSQNLFKILCIVDDDI